MKYLILSWHLVVKYLSNISKLRYTVSKLLYFWQIVSSLLIQHSNLFCLKKIVFWILSLKYKKVNNLLLLPSKTSFLYFVLNVAHAYLIIILSRNRFVTTPKCYKVKPEPYRFYNPQYHWGKTSDNFHQFTYSHKLINASEINWLNWSWSQTTRLWYPFTFRMIFLELYFYC